MRSNRDTIYQALFSLVAGIEWTPLVPNATNSFLYSSRNVKMYSEVDPSQRPALFMEQIGEEQVTPISQKGLPYAWHLTVMFSIFLFNNDPNVIGWQLLNPILDKIEATIQATPPQQLGLGVGGGVITTMLWGSKEKGYSGQDRENIFAFVPVTVLAL